MPEYPLLEQNPHERLVRSSESYIRSDNNVATFEETRIHPFNRDVSKSVKASVRTVVLRHNSAELREAQRGFSTTHVHLLDYGLIVLIQIFNIQPVVCVLKFCNSQDSSLIFNHFIINSTITKF